MHHEDNVLGIVRIVVYECKVIAFPRRLQVSYRQMFPGIAALLIQKKLNLLNSPHLVIH